jgi:hypothetical protein
VVVIDSSHASGVRNVCAIEYARLIRERNDPRWQQTTEVHTSSLTYQARSEAHYTARQTMEQLDFLLHGMATSSRTYGFDYQGGASLRRWQKKRPVWINACSSPSSLESGFNGTGGVTLSLCVLSRFFSTASLVHMCIFRMEVEHELCSVKCSYLCHIWLYMYV